MSTTSPFATERGRPIGHISYGNPASYAVHDLSAGAAAERLNGKKPCE
jgi:hypothetical protein